MKVKGRFLTIALLVTAVILTGCNGGAAGDNSLSGSISIVGSNTLTPLTSIWAEDFMNIHSRARIAVSGPGSGAGIAALINGTTDICQASREIKPREVEQAKARDVEPFEISVAIDALSLIVNPSNPVSELTLEQFSDIYTNKITNWREVGGNDLPIVAIARDTSSGTHVFFKEIVVQMQGLPTRNKRLEYGSRVLFLPSTEEGVSEVARNPNAIFYAGLGYITDSVKVLGVKKTADSPVVLPSIGTALDGSYPVARPLLYYTNGQPEGVVKAFIDYVLSPEGQAKVPGAGYVPLKKQ